MRLLTPCRELCSTFCTLAQECNVQSPPQAFLPQIPRHSLISSSPSLSLQACRALTGPFFWRGGLAKFWDICNGLRSIRLVYTLCSVKTCGVQNNLFFFLPLAFHLASQAGAYLVLVGTRGGGGDPGTETWKEKTCPRDSRVMFLRPVGICVRTCLAGDAGGGTQHKCKFLLLKGFSAFLLLAMCSCHNTRTHLQ